MSAGITCETRRRWQKRNLIAICFWRFAQNFFSNRKSADRSNPIRASLSRYCQARSPGRAANHVNTGDRRTRADNVPTGHDSRDSPGRSTPAGAQEARCTPAARPQQAAGTLGARLPRALAHTLAAQYRPDDRPEELHRPAAGACNAGRC